jgi:hypothetical protein
MKQGSWASEVSRILAHHHIPFHVRKRRNQLEVTVSSGIAVKKLIRLLIPYLVVKRPLARRLMAFPKAPARNRFTWIDAPYLDEICDLVDYVRQFSKGKNRRHRWDGATIREFFQK